MIKVVLFDFGGVLSKTGTKGFIQEKIAELYGRDPQEVDITDLHMDLRRGVSTDEDFFTELNKRLNGNVSKQIFLEKIHSAVEVSPKVYDLAARLRKHGIATGIFSNVFAMNADVIRKQGLYDGFDPVLLSCDEGCAKPDEEFYQKAVERTGVRPNEILLIDDQEKCMPPAEKMSMHVILATTPEQIVADTEALIATENGITLRPN